LFGQWNAIIQTPFLQLNTVFTIAKDGSNSIKIRVESDPYPLHLMFDDIRVEGNAVYATGKNDLRQPVKLEVVFQEKRFFGAMTLPDLGEVRFEGTKGRGVSLWEKLQEYGDLSVSENRYWQGKWIWDARQPEENANSEHLLVLFRRSFHIGVGMKPKLVVDITADSRYRLYVNGISVSVGPCKGDAHTTYYETVDVSEHLCAGNNVLAVKVLRYPSMEPFKFGEGGPFSIWRLQSAGLLVEASLRDETGIELESLHSNHQWRAYRHQGYRNIPSELIMWLGGTEEVDGRGAPQGWEWPVYDDAEWGNAIPFEETRHRYGILSPWNLSPRPIPFMYEQEKKFMKVTKTSGIERSEAEKLLTSLVDGSRLQIPAGHKIQVDLDAGELTTGYLTIRLRGGSGSTVKLLAAECYEGHDSQTWQRKKGNREDSSGQLLGDFDVYRVSGCSNDRTEEIYEPFWFRTFRYVRLEIETAEVPIDSIQLTYRETGYPLEVKAHFESSDQELNTIWDLSIRTLRRCMHETYEDCPYYEQLQYAMDSRLMMLYTYHVSSDDRMARRTIDDFYRSRQPSGLLQSRFPSLQSQIIPSFALYWVDMLAEHYAYNGDLELIMNYRPAMIELMDWFHRRLTKDGIIGVTSNRYWAYIDWVDAWPVGAPPESMERPMYLLSFMYAAALDKCASLLEVTGWSDAARTMAARGEQVRSALKRLAWCEERQLFRDLPGLDIFSQHTQVMAVLAEVIKGEEAKRLMERTLVESTHRVTLPFSYLLFQALKKVGMQAESFQLWDRWRVFASQGLTTLPETEENPRSDCHAWSAVPLAEFPATILGITPSRPGATRIRIEPQVGTLTWAKGSMATKHGLVQVGWNINGSVFKVDISVPKGIQAEVRLPNGSEQIMSGEGTFSCMVK
jgi:alpha-L-rhamnosidase